MVVIIVITMINNSTNINFVRIIDDANHMNNDNHLLPIVVLIVIIGFGGGTRGVGVSDLRTGMRKLGTS